jgi:hypothetical protein
VSSAYPIIWAMKHAPVADAEERLILIAMADAADGDGCNSYRSMRSHMLIAKGLSKSTINRRQHAMAKRGLIRLDRTPPPARYLKIPKNRRPPRWEVCIPYSWWSEAQREEIQRERADKGLPEITPQSRPDLPDAPARKARADKGKPNPNRGRKETRQAGADEQEDDSRGVSETPQGSDSWGVSETPPEVSTRQPRGSLVDTQPSFGDPPGVPEDHPLPAVGELPVPMAPRAAADAAESTSSRPTSKPSGAVQVQAAELYRMLPERLRERVPEHGSRRVLRTLAAELDQRTAPELAERISRRAEGWQYRAEDAENATAVAITIVRRGYDCPDVRCEDHARLDTGLPCSHCAQAQPAVPAGPSSALRPTSRAVERCSAHPGAVRRTDGECGGCWADRIAASGA